MVKKKLQNITQVFGLDWNHKRKSTQRKPDGLERGHLFQDNETLGLMKNRDFLDQIKGYAVSRRPLRLRVIFFIVLITSSSITTTTNSELCNNASQISNRSIPVIGQTTVLSPSVLPVNNKRKIKKVRNSGQIKC
jgi:hypothetical protein